MAGRLAGKTALITAAGQGIGFASAMQMAQAGATVIATDMNPKLLDQFKGVANITARSLDVLDDAAAGEFAAGGASRWWLHHSLAALTRDLAAAGEERKPCR